VSDRPRTDLPLTSNRPRTAERPTVSGGEETTFFLAVGGEPTFRRLVDTFYAGVAGDPLLRPMYPEEDLGPAAERLRLFLMQYWGGPNTYSAERGHPRLRMRHAPFTVDAAARDAWLKHMRHAVDALGLPEPHHSALWDYLERAAHFMVNTDG
jgi:hemoglobin